MRTVIGNTVAFAALALAAGASHARAIYEHAPVLESTPVYRSVHVSVPREECWMEEVVRYEDRGHNRSATPGILGAVIGGALGNAVGHNKSNKRVGAVVGAVVGGSVGRDIG